MDDLIAFLRARLGEREQALRALAAAGPTDELPELARGPMLLIQAAPAGREAEAFRELLADIEAKRRVVARLAGVHADPWSYDYAAQDVAQEILEELSSPYAAHPDYRPEWAPRAGQV